MNRTRATLSADVCCVPTVCWPRARPLLQEAPTVRQACVGLRRRRKRGLAALGAPVAGVGWLDGRGLGRQRTNPSGWVWVLQFTGRCLPFPDSSPCQPLSWRTPSCLLRLTAGSTSPRKLS